MVDKRWEDHNHSSISKPLPQKRPVVRLLFCCCCCRCCYYWIEMLSPSCCYGGGCSCRSVRPNPQTTPSLNNKNTQMDTQAAGQLSSWTFGKNEQFTSSPDLGKGLCSGNTDSRCAHGFTTNPAASLIEWCVSGCSPGS